MRQLGLKMRLGALLLIAACTASCVLLKARPIPPTSFLPHGDKLVEMEERAPFNGVWFGAQNSFYARRSKWQTLYIAPVNTAAVETSIARKWWPAKFKRQRIEELQEVGVYLREEFKAAMRAYPNYPFQLTDEPGERTLVLRLAVVQMTPTNAVINILGTVAGFFVTGGGTIKWIASGSIAIEGILREGERGDSLLEFKDREADKSALFTLRDFLEYAHIRRTVREWARQFAELTATEEGHKVKGSLPITLNPF